MPKGHRTLIKFLFYILLIYLEILPYAHGICSVLIYKAKLAVAGAFIPCRDHIIYANLTVHTPLMSENVSSLTAATM